MHRRLSPESPRCIAVGDMGAYGGLTSNPTLECRTNVRVTQLID